MNILFYMFLVFQTPPGVSPHVQAVWLNPDLVSRLYSTSHHLVLATSGGVLFLDPQNLEEQARVPAGGVNRLPSPVAIDLVGVGDTLWVALWKQGVAVGIPTMGTYTFQPYDQNPSFFPALKNVRHIAVSPPFFVEITDTLLAVFHTQHTARPADDDLVFYRFARVSPFGSVSRFLSVAASPESLYVGTDAGLYAAPWAGLTVDSLWIQRYPNDTLWALAWHPGGLAAGTQQGVVYRDTLYAQGLPVGMVAFTGDTLYLDPKGGLLPHRILPDGSEEELSLPDDATDVRDVVQVNGRVVYALGYGDSLNAAWEFYHIGQGLVVEENGTRTRLDLQGPSVCPVVSLDRRGGTLWVLGYQEGRPSPYPVSRWDGETWQTVPRSWLPRPRYIRTFSGGFFVTLWDATQGGLMVFDTTGTLKSHLVPYDPVVTALFVASDTTGLIASYSGDLYRYNLARDTLVYLGNMGGGGDAFPYSLHVDLEGRLWVGRYAGFSVYASPEHLEDLLFSDNGRVPAPVSAFAEDPSGNLWVGTLNGLYFVSADGAEVRFQNPPGILEIYDVLWVRGILVLLTSEGVGFYRAGPELEPIDEITPEDGLPGTPRPDPPGNPFLTTPRHGLVLDLEHGQVFVATDRGVAVLSLGTLFQGPAENQGVVVYPNPLSLGQPRFWITGPSPLTWYGLFTMSGRRVEGLQVFQEEGVLVVDGADRLAPGLYFGVVKTGNDRFQRFKLAVVR